VAHGTYTAHGLNDSTSERYKSQHTTSRSITNEGQTVRETDTVISYSGGHVLIIWCLLLASIVVTISVRFSGGASVTSSSTSDCCLIILSPLLECHVPIYMPHQQQRTVYFITVLLL